MLEINKQLIKDNFKGLDELLHNTKISNDLKLTTAKNGSPSLEITQGGITKHIHSRYDPQKEARGFIDAFTIPKDSLPLIFGFGLGYHIEALLDIYKDFKRIYIFEPRLDVLKLALGSRDLSRILIKKNISIICGYNTEYSIGKLHEIIHSTGNNTYIIIHEPSLEMYSQTLPDLKNILQRLNVEPKMRRIMRVNFQRNLNFTLRSPGVKELFNKFKNKPVILISAGPSLMHDLDTLRTIQDKALLISVTTPLKLLIKNNIRPDIIAIGDPKQIMRTHIEGLENLNIPLLFLPTAANNVLEVYNGPRIVALQNGYKLCDTIEEKISKGRVDVGESVATMVLDTAIKTGASPIIFAGQDLGFPGGHTHTQGIEKNLRIKNTSLTVKSVSDQEIATSRVLLWFKDWIEKRIARDSDRTYINVSQTGARIKGTIEMTLEEAAEAYCSDSMDKSQLSGIFK